MYATTRQEEEANVAPDVSYDKLTMDRAMCNVLMTGNRRLACRTCPAFAAAVQPLKTCAVRIELSSKICYPI